MANPDLVKIAFRLNAEESDGITRERLRAKPMPDGTFLLDNSPFHVYGVSYRDSVHAELEEEETGLLRCCTNEGDTQRIASNCQAAQLMVTFLSSGRSWKS